MKITPFVVACLLPACALHQAPTAESRRTRPPTAHSAQDDLPATPPARVVAPAGEFASAINPILKTSCGGGTCHGVGSQFGAFVDAEATVAERAARIGDRVRSGSMPTPGSGFAISPDAKAKLLAYTAKTAAAVAPPTTTTPTTVPPTTMPPTTDPAIPKRPRECPDPADVGTPASLLTFTDHIAPVLDKSCGGAGTCHGPGSQGREVFVAEEAKYKALANGVLYHLKRGSMPQGGRDLSPDDKAKLIQFLCPPSP